MPVFDNVNPNAAAETASTRTEVELREAQAKVTELQQKLELEKQVLGDSTLAMRAAAVAVHAKMCPHNHTLGACTWTADKLADDPAQADWTEPAHVRWLGVVQGAVALLTSLGWKISEPAA